MKTETTVMLPQSKCVYPCWMIRFQALFILLFATASFHLGIRELPAQETDSSPNVLLICVDDLRPELNCFGRSHIVSPHIDKLAATGVRFSRHYVQAPTCGASRFTLLTGHYGSGGNGALFARAKRIKSGQTVPPSMPAWFKQHGYETVSVGKVSHHPGGRGGPDWNDDQLLEMPESWTQSIAPSGAWLHPRGWMHGLADGEIRKKAGDMALFQTVDGPDSSYPDGHSIEDAIGQLQRLTKPKSKPFFLAVGILRPHLPFGAPRKYLLPYADANFPPIAHPNKPTGKTTWHRSGEFMKYKRWGKNPNQDPQFALEVRKHYAACVSYADAMVGRLMAALEKSGQADDTIVVLWGDHGWHLGEHAIWGKHSLFEESLRSPLIVRNPIAKRAVGVAGEECRSIVETIDIFPTLCELTGIDIPESCDGVSLVGSFQANHKRSSKNNWGAISYHGSATTIRTEQYRLIKHKGGQVELYDHQSPEKETINVASTNENVVKELTKKLADRLQDR